MRKNYIDNLRFIFVLMLFPYHIFMIYNSFGENFYIKGDNIDSVTTFIVLTGAWFMPLLFVIAGISTTFALQKRNFGEFAKERTTKLITPLIAGILLVIPAQTYFAERFHNGYTGGYFAQYILFFTKETDLTGYTGGFTPAHLWFVFYLFIISLLAIPLIALSRKIKFDIKNLATPFVVSFFILPFLGNFVLDIGGHSFGEYFAYFMLGYFVLSNENIQQRLEKYRIILLSISLIFMTLRGLFWYGILNVHPLIFTQFYAWTTILVLIGFGRKYLDIKNKFTKYMVNSSFAVYIFHQTWIIVVGYYVLQAVAIPFIQMPLILVFSVILTFISYEVCKRLKVTRWLFAIKK
ncbi:MAG: acyltransferase family protein [Defluviitaleaceae bacterium]|nr:acyltransferase family protein [Defluviitaleaceae bacterium]